MNSTEEISQPQSALRMFNNRNYALYFGGQLISQIGTWMQMVALSWFTYALTKSPFLLALVGVSSQLPALLCMPFAGVAADRVNRHRLLIATQSLAMIQASILAYLTLTHQIQIVHLIVLGLFAGIINAFDMPTRSAFVVGLVERKEDLPNAIAINSSLMNVTRLIGPALAGFIIAAAGAGMCFLINALSYIAVIGALLFVRGDFNSRRTAKSSLLTELKDGFRYAWKTTPVRALILLLATFGLGGMAYALLLPVYVKSIGGNANTLGYLMAASALGSLVGTVILALRNRVVGLGRWIVVSSFLYSLGLIAFSFAANVNVAMVLLAFLGLMMILQMASTNTILQAIVDEDKRGRVMSLFTMAFMGAGPLGGLICGALADRIGFAHTIFACGIYCMVVSLAFLSQTRQLRQATHILYIDKGIMSSSPHVPARAANVT